MKTRTRILSIACALALASIVGAAAAPTRTLVIALLKVESSYARNVEQPKRQSFDTVQWSISGDSLWRIKTYALDHDVHMYEFVGTRGDLVRLAVENTKKHYGDVLDTLLVIPVPAPGDERAIKDAIAKAGLEPRVEVSDKGWVFWHPDTGTYRTQTRPKE